jgi:3D (Asp-Asp-Asp) domain-containing protein
MKYLLSLLSLLVILLGCSTQTPIPQPKKQKIPIIKIKKQSHKKSIRISKKHFSLRVTATAYTSRKRETDSTPTIGAWNNKLSPKRKSIAVSNDLLKMGLGNGARVRIKGLRGIYTVRDKMHRRWRKKIDIYMGTNLKKARRWGKRKVTIYWDKKMLRSN